MPQFIGGFYDPGVIWWGLGSDGSDYLGFTGGSGGYEGLFFICIVENVVEMPLLLPASCLCQVQLLLHAPLG